MTLTKEEGGREEGRSFSSSLFRRLPPFPIRYALPVPPLPLLLSLSQLRRGQEILWRQKDGGRSLRAVCTVRRYLVEKKERERGAK